MAAKYFGTNGVRGTLENITPDFISKLCASFVTVVNAKQVLVARDTRTTGELVEGAVVSGLLWAGAQPVLMGIMPSPAVEFLGKKRGVPSIIITSSHNPPEWVALKFNDERGVAFTKERGEEIERIYEEGKWKRTTWDRIPPVQRDDKALNEYIEVLRRWCLEAGSGPRGSVGWQKSTERKIFECLNVVIDCGNGTAGRVAPAIFREFGAKVTVLNGQEDGFFPGRNPEPTEQNVQGLIKAVKEVGADLGIAYDGDGDRLALVDEKGNYVLGDKVFAIAVDIMYEEGGKGDVVTTVATSNIIKEVAAKYGGKVKYVKVGAPYIAEEMERSEASRQTLPKAMQMERSEASRQTLPKANYIAYITGGEEVGGIIWPKIHPGKDAILSSLRIAGMLVQKGKKLSEVVDMLPKFANVKIKIEMGQERFEKIKKLQDRMRGKENAVVIDGVRLDFDDGWCIARASGTENFVRIFGEAKNEKRAWELVELMRKELELAG